MKRNDRSHLLGVHGATAAARVEVIAHVYALETLGHPLLQRVRDGGRERAGSHGERAEDRGDVRARRNDGQLEGPITLANDFGSPDAEVVGLVGAVPMRVRGLRGAVIALGSSGGHGRGAEGEDGREGDRENGEAHRKVGRRVLDTKEPRETTRAGTSRVWVVDVIKEGCGLGQRRKRGGWDKSKKGQKGEHGGTRAINERWRVAGRCASGMRPGHVPLVGQEMAAEPQSPTSSHAGRMPGCFVPEFFTRLA